MPGPAVRFPAAARPCQSSFCRHQDVRPVTRPARQRPRNEAFVVAALRCRPNSRRRRRRGHSRPHRELNAEQQRCAPHRDRDRSRGACNRLLTDYVESPRCKRCKGCKGCKGCNGAGRARGAECVAPLAPPHHLHLLHPLHPLHLAQLGQYDDHFIRWSAHAAEPMLLMRT